MKLLSSLKSLIKKNTDNYKSGKITPSNLISKAKPLIKKTLEMLDQEVKTAKEKLKDIPGTNYKLGLHHLKLGNLSDAVMRFKMVVYLVPDMAPAYYNLGRALIREGKINEAKENLEKALSLQADFPEANYELCKIEKPESIDSIPQNIINEHLEWRSEDNKESLETIEQLDKFFINSILTNIHDKNPNLDVLDLGSNLGGRGGVLRRREVARKIIGVDINTKSNEANKKQLFEGETVYNNVITNEISAHLAENKEKYDIVLAGNIFSYHRKLDNIFSNIALALKQGGILALIIKENELSENYTFDIEENRFNHSVQYFEEIMKIAGFNIEEKKHKEVSGISFTIFTAKSSSR